MFGFITGDDGKDYFVHVTGLKPGVKIYENDLVSFEVEETDRGPKAVEVEKTGEAAPAESSDEDSQGSEQEPAEESEEEYSTIDDDE